MKKIIIILMIALLAFGCSKTMEPEKIYTLNIKISTGNMGIFQIKYSLDNAEFSKEITGMDEFEHVVRKSTYVSIKAKHIECIGVGWGVMTLNIGNREKVIKLAHLEEYEFNKTIEELMF